MLENIAKVKMYPWAQKGIVTTLMFGRMFPILFIMIHYTTVAVWYGEAECSTVDGATFTTYFILVTLLAVIWASLLMWWTTSAYNQWLKIGITVLSGALSGSLFIVWSLLRAKPFKCFTANENLVYVMGPVLFWVVHLLGVGASFFIVQRLKMESMENLTEVKLAQNNTSDL